MIKKGKRLLFAHNAAFILFCIMGLGFLGRDQSDFVLVCGRMAAAGLRCVYDRDFSRGDPGK